MHGVYETLQREGKTGPFEMLDGKLQAKPYVEYPKWVTKADGKRVIVKNLTEEIEVAGGKAPEIADPLKSERQAVLDEAEKLRKQSAEMEQLQTEMKAQLAELQEAREALQAGTAKLSGQQAGAGSKFRPTPAPTTMANPPTKQVETKSEGNGG